MDDSFDFDALMSKVDALEQTVLPESPRAGQRAAGGSTPEARADAVVERLEASLAKYSGGKTKSPRHWQE